MVERSLEGFDLYPAKLIGDTAHGTPPSPADSLRHRPLPARLLPSETCLAPISAACGKTTHQRL
jgi:hypothetical protein